MSSLSNFRDLQVLDGGSPAPGGNAINENFKLLATWRPKCNWEAEDEPTPYDDSEDEYWKGSLWLFEDSGVPRLFICVDPAVGNADWREIELSTP